MKTLAYHYDFLRLGLTIGASKIDRRAFNANFSMVYFDKMKDPKLPREDFVRVRNIQTGICGSDMSLYTAHQSPQMSLAWLPSYQTNTYMGHETVGIVEEVGSAVTSIKVGDRVVLQKYLPCCATKGIPPEEWCDNCKKEDYVICTNMGQKAEPVHVIGAGMGDQYLAPETCVMKIPDCISNDYATMIEPCAVSMHAVHKKIPNPGDKVVVLGGGMIGLNVVQFIKLLQPDCTVYLLEKAPMKQEIAKRVGADEIISGDPYAFLEKKSDGTRYVDSFNKKNEWLLNGVDVVFDTIGAQWAFNMGIHLLKARGTYVKVGIQMVPTTIDETPIWNQELNIIGVDSYGLDSYHGEIYQSFHLVRKLMEENKIDLEGFITHRFPLEQYKDGFSQVLFHGNDTIKVVLECE